MAAGYRNSIGDAHVRMSVDDDAGLSRQVAGRMDIDFESFAPGSATVIAELRWDGDGGAVFTGLTGTHRLAATGRADDAGRVAAHWKGFTETQRLRNEADRARFRRATPEAGHHHSYLVMDSLHVVRDGEHLREEMTFRSEFDYGLHRGDGTRDEPLATLRIVDGGCIAFESTQSFETLPKGTRPEILAERWEGFVARALEAAGPPEEQDAPAPRM